LALKGYPVKRKRKIAPQGFCSVDEFSGWSGVSIHTLYKWWEKGKGPRGKMIGGLICYPIQEFIDFMKSDLFEAYKRRRKILATQQARYAEMYDAKGKRKEK
jgi:hypothetical protein